MAGHRVSFHVLGPLRVVVDDTEVPIASRRQRALLVLLLMNVGRVVPSERLIDQLWDGAPPPQGAVTLRSYVSNLRQALGGQTGVGAALGTRGHGYCLDVPAQAIDAVRLSRQSQEGRDHLRRGRPDAALEAFDEAVDAWDGGPLADIADHEAASSMITQLTETYLGAVEGRFASLLALGRHGDALPDLEAFVADHPLREEPRALLMTALHRAGRTPESLEVHRAFRELLREELGIDPSDALDKLHQRILEQDPTLAPAPYQLQAEVATTPSAPHPHPPSAPPPRSMRASPQRPGALLVGRGRELTVITHHLDALLASGAGALLLVSGEPGIGKTTLLEALEERARRRGCPVYSGRSPAAGSAPAFWPWRQVVDSIAAGLDDGALTRSCAGAAKPVAHLSAAIAERTGQAIPVHGDDPRTVRFLLYEAVATFLRQAMKDRPLVITLDDIHWADLPSLELLSYLTPSLATRPTLVVGAYRDLPAERTEALDATLATVSREDVVHELPLTGLGAADVADLMQSLLADTSGPSAREPLPADLHERTGGNPFFVKQLARLILEGQGADTDPSSVPPGVRHVIARRLAALPQTVQAFLAAAAVVGREFDLRVAATTAGMDVADALDSFDEAARHGLVEHRPADGPERRFVHALVQEVVLERLPSGRAARLHASLAARLEQDSSGNPDELARHTWAARDILGSAAVPSLVAAAEAAAAVYSLEQAEGHLRRALELVRADSTPDPSTELSLLLGLFRIITTGRGWGDVEARAVIERAMQLVESGGYSDDTARLWWSMTFFLLDRNDESYVDVGNTLLAAVEDADRTARTREQERASPTRQIGHASCVVAHLISVFSALHAGDRARALTHLRTARHHVEAAPPAELAAFDEHLHVMLLLIEGYWAAFTGDEATHRSTTDASVALADADGRPFPRAVARTLGAASGVYVADPAYVQTLAADALRLDERFGFGWLASLAHCIHGWADAHVQGTTSSAHAVIEAQIADIVAQGRRGNESILSIMLADVYRLEGRMDDARRALLRARENPDSYRGLTVDLIDKRLRQLP
ncbi:MAG TPA: BTAD domain-containing putative transcriptional regulator [Nocardioidaceae bacterium]|nr:BTAD domain-containing putative transcriptional regulator [Nocardioidaceae bacterium]